MKYRHAVGYSVMVVLLFATVIGNAQHNSKLEVENQTLRSKLHWIDESSLRLAKGEGVLAIYSLTDTNQLLSCFANRPDVYEVSLEVTDVGNVGISAIASMPNVQSISFSGDFGVNDETLLLLANCSQLKSLELTCTKVTEAGIVSLRAQLPNCKIQRH